jgi:hypothetical protein
VHTVADDENSKPYLRNLPGRQSHQKKGGDETRFEVIQTRFRDDSDSNFKAQHRPGTLIRFADILSRQILTVTTSHTVSRELVKEEQGKNILKMGSVY